MDQVRDIARTIWQQRFWVLSALGVLVAVFCWYRAAGDLQARFSSRKGTINSTFGKVNNLTSGFHPNEEVIKVDRAQAVEQREQVLKVWNELYERQRKEVLEWPREVIDQQFADKIEKGEVKFLDPISSGMRDRYLNYIANQFDGMLKIVSARKGADGARKPSRFREDRPGANRNLAAATEEEAEDYLVEWIDQGDLQGLLSFEQKPTSEQVWVTQEDLWVYKTLLNVIANTNKLRGASRPDNTAVREIIELKVGRPAAPGSQGMGSVYIPQSADGTGGGLAGEDMGGGVSGSRPAGPDLLGGEGAAADVLGFRYLDSTGQPIPGGSENFGAEYRQLPIRMVLTMDQRWLPQVLVQCANAALPVKVEQIRINPERAREGLGGSTFSTRNKSGKPGAAPDANLARVELQGVVYIYMPPDPELLSVPGVEPEQLASTTPAPS